MNRIVNVLTYFIFFVILINSVCLCVHTQPLNHPIQQLMLEAQHAKERFQFEQAKNLYEEIIKLEPGIPNHYVEISKLWIGLNDVEQSRMALEKALECDSHHAEALTLLAIYYQDEKQDYPKAESVLQTVLQYHPNHQPAQKLFVEMLIEQRKLDAAIELMNQINPTSMPPGYTEYLKAKIAFLLNDNTAALKAFQSAEQKGFSPPELHRYLAQLYHQNNMPEQAQKHQQQFQTLTQTQNERKQMWQLLRLHPNDAGRWFALGIHYLASHDLENALSYLDKGLELDAKQAKIQSLAGKIALRLNHPKQAISYIKAALALQPDSYDDWNNLGVCHILLKEYQQAVTAYETSIQKGNSSPQIYENLASAKAKLSLKQQN